jgi:hypothetical protein
MQKLLIVFTIYTAIFCDCINAQSVVKHIAKYKVTPSIIKNAEDLITHDECTIAIENTIAKNEKTNVFSFDGTHLDEDAQIDPQIAVGANYVLHASNAGVIIYDKKGEIKTAQTLECFTQSLDCFDPKTFYDASNKYFGLAVWDGYNTKGSKPMKLCFSQTDNPMQAWNIYSLPASNATDGGSIGYGKKWIVYRYDDDFVLLMNAQDSRLGKPTTIYKFNTVMGQPIYNQDDGKTYAIRIDKDNKKIILQTINEIKGVPIIAEIWRINNTSAYTDEPAFSAQRGTEILVSSGDFHPKNAVLQNNSIWFSHIVNNSKQSAIEWFQIDLKSGTILQKGLIANNNTNYIQPTIAVNKRGDMAIGFQETNANMAISIRAAYRLAGDKVNTTRKIIPIAEGDSPYNKKTNEDFKQAWGDYSGAIVDGYNGIDFWFAQSYMQQNKVSVKLFSLLLNK